MRLLSRDAKFAADIAECTHDNAGLLNAVISRTNAVEAAGQVAQGIIEQTVGKVDGLDVETLKGLAKLEGNVVERETSLRKQLDAVAAHQEEGHAELQGLIAKAARAPHGPLPAGEAGALGERLRIMGEKVDVQLASMGKIVDEAGTKV